MLDFEEFFDCEYDGMVRALTLAFGDRVAAEDAAQEGFSRAFVRWRRVSMMERPAAWVYVVAVRHHRRRTRRHGVTVGSDRDRAAVDEVGELMDRLMVSNLLDVLTPRQRKALVLRYHADLPLDQVAKALGCRVGTVKATLHQALALLRRTVEEDATDAAI